MERLSQFDPLTPPNQVMPSDACDSHVYVLGPFDRYPLAARAATDLLAMLDGAGIDRAVLSGA